MLLFVASLPAVTARLYASDEIEYYSYLRSLWFDHDLSFDNEYRYFSDNQIARGVGFRETFIDLSTPTGLRLNFGTMGAAIMWAPLYIVADGGVRIARAAGIDVEADGYSRPYLAAVAYGSALYGFLAVLLSAFIASRLVGDGERAAGLLWVGTPLPFYMYLAPGMAHACSAFAVAAFVASWLSVRQRWSMRGLMALGALAGLMTMVREQDALFVTGVALDYAWTLVAAWPALSMSDLMARARGLAAGIAAGIVAFLPQAWAYVVLNGRLGPAQVVADKMRWYSPHAGQVLMSPEHGLFVWTPLALLGVVGLVLWSLRASDGTAPAGGVTGDTDTRRVVICLLVMVAAQVYISGSVDTWTVAGSFGQRRFLGASVALAVGLAALLKLATGWRRPVAAGLILLSVWWNLGLMVQFGASMMDRQKLELRRNAYNTYVRVPLEMPGIAYRYFFNRASFYRPPTP